MIDVVDDLMLFQHVSTPTRIRIGQNPSRLDLDLTKFPETLSDLRIFSPLAKSDHALLHTKVWIHRRSIERAAPPGLNFSAFENDVIKHYAGRFDWNSLNDLRTISGAQNECPNENMV